MAARSRARSAPLEFRPPARTASHEHARATSSMPLKLMSERSASQIRSNQQCVPRAVCSPPAAALTALFSAASWPVGCTCRSLSRPARSACKNTGRNSGPSNRAARPWTSYPTRFPGWAKDGPDHGECGGDGRSGCDVTATKTPTHHNHFVCPLQRTTDTLGEYMGSTCVWMYVWGRAVRVRWY